MVNKVVWGLKYSFSGQQKEIRNITLGSKGAVQVRYTENCRATLLLILIKIYCITLSKLFYILLPYIQNGMRIFNSYRAFGSDKKRTALRDNTTYLERQYNTAELQSRRGF